MTDTRDVHLPRGRRVIVIDGIFTAHVVMLEQVYARDCRQIRTWYHDDREGALRRFDMLMLRWGRSTVRTNDDDQDHD